MVKMLAIALGAVIGANLRYGLSTWATQRLGATWPYGTVIINVLGCLLIGILLTLASTRLSFSEPVRLLLVTGLLGSFTTFSSFSYESYTLVSRGNWLGAGIYVGVSVIVGLLASFFGAEITRLIAG